MHYLVAGDGDGGVSGHRAVWDWCCGQWLGGWTVVLTVKEKKEKENNEGIIVISRIKL